VREKEKRRTYLLNIRRQQAALVTLRRTAAHLTHELVELLLVKNAIAVALELVPGRLGQRGLAHDATSNTAAAAVRGAAGADAAHDGDGRGHLRRLLGQDLGDGQLALQRLLAGLRVARVLLRELVRVLLLLGRADDARAGARGRLRGRAGLASWLLLAGYGDAARALVGDVQGC